MLEPKQHLSMILAMADDGTIGDRGKLPWAIPEDMQHFKKITMGHPIIMGRKTHESIGKKLPGRLNIVVSRAGFYSECSRAHDLHEALAIAEMQQPGVTPFVIGGAQLYEAAWSLVDVIHLTEVHKRYPTADTIFDRLLAGHGEFADARGIFRSYQGWREVDRRPSNFAERFPTPQGIVVGYSPIHFVTLERIAPEETL